MNLPKISKTLIFVTLFTLCSLLSTLIFPSQALAQDESPCALQNCIPGDRGWCNHDAVVGCIEGNMICDDGTWVNTPEGPRGSCTYDDPVTGKTGKTGALDKKIIKAREGKGLNVEKFITGDKQQTIAGVGDLILFKTNLWLGAIDPDEGAIREITGLIGSMYENPPASTGEYLADLGKSLGIVRPAYAQGTGWQALDPILPIWKAFRNIAYMGFVIIFIAIGFMIMFRAKINPQTVISIQSALPKIVITLILVTFSYAIAGLMIDLIYILIYLIVGVFQLGGLIENSSNVIDKLLTKNPFSIIYPKGSEDLFTSGSADALQEIVSSIFGAYGYESKDAFLGETVGALSKAILAVAVLFKVFSLFFSLLMSYLGIIMSVIFAPFSILLNALPGSTSFVSWVKGLFANVIVFPIVAGMFLIAAVLIGPKGNTNPWGVSDDVGFYSQQGEQTEVWVPPLLIGEVHDEEAGPSSVNAFQGLIALGMIMMMPTVVGKVKKMLKVEPSGFGGAIVGGLLAGPSAVGGFAQQAYGMYAQRMSVKASQSRIDQARGESNVERVIPQQKKD